MHSAYAIAITSDNVGLIVSESGQKQSRSDVETWIATFGTGYFLRDESSVLDCKLFKPTVFTQIYSFKHAHDTDTLIREVIKN